MVANNRTFYATQALLLKPQTGDGAGVDTTAAGWLSPKGIQSVGITTNFNLTQVFQMGQLELYDRPEEIPEVQVTINKIIDGTAPLYLMCMGGTTTVATNNGKTLVELANNRVNVRLGIFGDTNSAATGASRAHVDMSGMYLSSFTYTFPLEGQLTEEVTLVGNKKTWGSGLFGTPASTSIGFGHTGSGTSPNTMMRANVMITGTNVVWPTGAGGIALPSGGSGTQQLPHFQSVTISSNLGREVINELGRFVPYYRYVTFPLEITSEFTIIGTDGDNIAAEDFTAGLACGAQTHNVPDSIGGVVAVTGYRNLVDKEIKVAIQGKGCDDILKIDLGKKNKLTSVNYSGGDTGGGNATVAYSFSTYNTFILSASGTFIEQQWIDQTDDAVSD